MQESTDTGVCIVCGAKKLKELETTKEDGIHLTLYECLLCGGKFSDGAMGVPWDSDAVERWETD